MTVDVLMHLPSLTNRAIKWRDHSAGIWAAAAASVSNVARLPTVTRHITQWVPEPWLEWPPPHHPTSFLISRLTTSLLRPACDWRLGMEERHEKAWTANQNQRDRLPREDGAGASDCGRAAAHPPPPPKPSLISSLPWHSIASRCCYGVDVRLPDHSEHIRRDSLKSVTDRGGGGTLVHLNVRRSESWRGTTYYFFFDG